MTSDNEIDSLVDKVINRNEELNRKWKMTSEQYSDTANQLVERIKELFKVEPEAKNIKGVFDLFKYPQFKCDDLAPSLYQAQWAFKKAIQDE